MHFILLIYFSFSCGEKTIQPDLKSTDTLNTYTKVVTAVSDSTSPAYHLKSIQTIARSIDSIYDIKQPETIDTIRNYKLHYELGPDALDLTDIQGYYRYFSFDFIEFNDKTAAQKQFDRIVRAGDSKRNDRSDPNHELYWKIFSKGGSTYTLYDKMIIYHERMCSYNEKIEIPKEDELLDSLFNNKFPKDIYFIRVRCGWTQYEKK